MLLTREKEGTWVGELAGVLEDGADRVSTRYRDAVNAYYKKLSEEQ